MGILRDITGSQVLASLETAAQRSAAVSSTIQYKNTWLSFRSQMLSTKDGLLWMAVPGPTEGIKAEDLIVGQEVGLHFRLNAFRYYFQGVLSAPTIWELGDGKKIQALTTPLPTQLHQLERRAYERFDVPSSMSVRACAWVGNTPRPVWPGKVQNVSLGGLQMRTARTCLNFFDPGDVVTMAITFNPNDRPVIADAHFRHGTVDGDMALLGLEFCLLTQIPDGKVVMEQVIAGVELVRQASMA